MAGRTPTGSPRPARPDPLVGAVIAGRYRIEARLASGGMGTVYRAEQLGLDRKVALKLLHAAALEGTQDSQTDDDSAVLEKRFSREAAILARLAHPNVVTIFDYGSVDEVACGSGGDERDRTRPRFYMAMELIGGETLQERLTKRKQLPIEETLNIGRQIARGLREAHALGVVHRDLKPANIMIVRDRDGEELVKLLDFGIGKVLDKDAPISSSDPRAELTQEGRFVGSPMYMAPEQIAHGRVDLRTDIYAIGTVLYRCLAGAHPFHKDNTALVMLAHLHEKPIPLADRVPEAPRWLTDLVDRCMEKEPDLRPQSMDEVLKTLTDMAPLSSGSRISLPRNPVPPLPPSEAGPTIASGGPELSTLTNARPVTVSGARSQRSAGKRTPWMFIAIGLAFAIGVVVVILTRVPKTEEKTAAPPPPSAPLIRTFTLTVESTPSGAEVSEGDQMLGRTPLQLSIESDVVKSKPRTFVLRRSGYEPYTVVQGPSAENVRVMAPLVADPTPAPTASVIGKPPHKPPPPPKASVTAPPPDINLKR
jgi:serine/threonine protein kinase